MAEEQVVLVNEQGGKIGLMGKQEAHEKGLLHKAISIIIYNSNGDMLLQQRALTKYHWAGIWSNTCCSHPRDNESYAAAASRRLMEECGFNTELTEEFNFIYKAKDEASGLTEHEFDTVFTGIFDGDFTFNTDEIEAVRWMPVEELLVDIITNPDTYSFWFKIILEELQKRNQLHYRVSI
jgi:isopentenyl-diphosphate delta-isomerase